MLTTLGVAGLDTVSDRAFTKEFFLGVWECHIEPDWLLIYDITATEVLLIRTGSHSDLFE